MLEYKVFKQPLSILETIWDLNMIFRWKLCYSIYSPIGINAELDFFIHSWNVANNVSYECHWELASLRPTSLLDFQTQTSGALVSPNQIGKSHSMQAPGYDGCDAVLSWYSAINCFTLFETCGFALSEWTTIILGAADPRGAYISFRMLSI